ncbi:MAG: protein-L-isoaspartate O-methyltransferase [Flavobacteriaceae bacterium]|nr:protein-L-isoaspartate O-methyltransferase [Flavobacteriaceae bacterium]|tara:strand:+ start:13794 stop:14435 length:642 start_codon:yes stop_codon:yes gene_type:complete
MIDTSKHQGQRKQLVDQLKDKGIKDTKVLDAIAKVPRHLFMDPALEDYSYLDKAFPIAAGQTISQPYTVAFQTQLLKVKKGEKVLEIGTGSGYQASILVNLGVKLYSIERQQELYKKASRLLNNLGLKPKKTIFQDGTLGLAEHSPYDAIIVTAAAETVPKIFLDQLSVRGRLVIPVGKNSQKMIRYTKIKENKIKREVFGNFRFVPLLKNKA